MRARLSSVVMVSVVLAMVLSAVAVVAPGAEPASAQTGGLNSWVRHDLPTTLKWQMAPNTDIWDLTAADDGTLFALVEDTSGLSDLIGGGIPTWDGLRWAVFPAWSDVSLFKSTDGGYTWTLVWHVPASDSGAPVAVVPQPGYVDGDAEKDVIFLATGCRYISLYDTYVGGPLVVGGEGNLYRSMDGGNIFTRVTPRCPAVLLSLPGTITSLDVAENLKVPGTYMAVVGVSSVEQSALGAGRGEGVYTWNEDNDRDWQDLQVANALPPVPFPGTMPAGNGLDVLAVKVSDSYNEDGCIMAVVNDRFGGDPAGQLPGVFLCYWDGKDGVWGGDVDSPTTAQLWPAAVAETTLAACIDTADDFTKVVNNYVFVGIDGSFAVVNNDVWRIRGLSTVTGPSTATAMGLNAPIGPGLDRPIRISDVVVKGPAASGAVYAGCDFPDGQAQVFKAIQATLWPAWTPSFKPPSGAWPVLLTDMSGTLMAAGCSDMRNTGGVHKMVEGAGGRNVFNGVGLMDDIAVSEDIPGYVNPGVPPSMTGTSWCYADARYMDVSPSYATDNLMYVTTLSEWYSELSQLSLWRWTDGLHWERIMYEYTILPTNYPTGATTFARFRGKEIYCNHGENLWQDIYEWTWIPQVVPNFSEDPYMFLNAGRDDNVDLNFEESLWYSPDKGDTWIAAAQMPLGAMQTGAGLSESGWRVVDNNTVLMGDMDGWVYKTADRGASWTEGALTAPDLEVTWIMDSPIYSESGGEGTDKAILAGTFDESGDQQSEVWISQDGAVADFENVGAEIDTDSSAWGYGGPLGGTIVQFDPGWVENHIAYASAGGWLDRWQLVGTGSKELTRIDATDVGIYRTVIDPSDPSASTWEMVWGADDFNAIALPPKPLPNMDLVTWNNIFRFVIPSGLEIGNDGTLYVPIALWDWSYNNDDFTGPGEPPSPNGQLAFGRFTAGGVLRCLEPTQAVTEWNFIDQGLGEWDGLLWNRAVPSGSNTLISLAWDWREWRWKLAIYDDTLCTKSDPAEPVSGDTAVGNIAGNKVSVVLDWGQLDADVYQWQIDDDCGFVAPMVKEGTTSETLVTVTGLAPDVKYCWRARALEPTLSRWSDAQSFTTIIGMELYAPQLVSPKAGAIILNTRPVFQWSAIGWADQYQLQVATDNGFAASAIVVDQALGNTQGYQSPVDLAKGTYYWRVKAMSSTSQTEWSSTGIFTVASKLPGAGTQPWVWGVIVLGVIMLLLIIWLIVKTRTIA